MVAGLIALYQHTGVVPTASFLTLSKDVETEQVLANALGFRVSLKTLYNQAMMHFSKDFTLALTSAGMKVDRPANATQNWTSDLTIKGLKALYDSGYYPSRNFLTGPVDLAAQKILIVAVGFPTTLSTLYNQTLKFQNGELTNGLRTAGIVERPKPNPRDLYHQWVPEDSYRGLRALYENGFSPNAEFLKYSQDPIARRVLVATLGFETSLKVFYIKTRILHKGHFANALTRAGLPTDEIMLANRNGVDPFALLSKQYEWVEVDGTLLFRPLLGEPPKSPLDQALDAELLKIALNAVPRELQSLGEEVIDVIISGDLKEPNPANILARIRADGGVDVTLEKVQQVLRHLASSKEFREYLRGSFR